MPILTKRERQDAKLALADNDRRARNLIEPGRYIDVSADATQLPTRYAVGDNTNLVINPNISGLLPGRPWNSTTSVYAILAFEPKLVFDFTGNVFKTGGGISTFSNSITHARAGNATMTDADGLLKWAPHNLLIRSEETNVWGQTGAGGVVVDNAVAPDGTTTAATFTIGSTNFHRYIRSFGTYTTGDKITYSFWVRSDTVTTLPFGINGGANQANNTIFGSLTVTSTWQLVEFEFTVLGDDNSLYYIIGKQPHNPVNCQLGDVEIWHPHAYRSSLGGMANNPAQSTGFETYAPTTSSPVYLPRVGHHIYNGSAWVNEGILHESEARTNVCTYSNDFGNLAYQKWLPANMTVTPNSAISPDGTTNATKFDMASGGYTRKLSGHAPTAGQTYTFSVWIKAGTVSEVKTAMLFSGGGLGYTELTHTLTNEWQRFSITKTVPSGTQDQVRARIIATQAGTIFVYGAQMEEGATPSSYISTDSVAVTRAAETLTVPAANLPYPTTPDVIGPELVTNGTFATDISGWTSYNSVISWDAGLLKVNDSANAGAGSQAYQVVTLEVGKRYRLTGSYENSTASRLWIDNSSSNVNPNGPTADFIQVFLPATTPSVDFAHTFVATATTTSIALEVDLFGTAYFDNISVKEVNPLALSIQIDGKMTYADNGATASSSNNMGEVTFVKWQETNTKFIGVVLNTLTSRVGQVSVRQRNAINGFDEVASAVDAYSPDVNVPFNLAGRYGSTFINAAHEGTLLTANTTPTILPDLSSTDLDLGSTFMGTIGEFRMWSDDLTDAGIVEATEPSTEPSLQLTFDGSSTSSFKVLDWSE